MQGAEPILDDEADRLFASLRSHAVMLLAVSGGADSMALMLLADRWRGRSKATSILVHTATVDHGLRPEARLEAEWVGDIAAKLGLPHRILSWDAAKPKSGIQQAARNARYRLLRDHATEIGAGVVVTAHHQDDQAETVLMRLARGSGIDGLAGMAPLSDGIARPLLGLPKSRLVATLEHLGVTWREDPSNDSLAFERVRLRRVLPYLREAGLTAEPIATSANRLRRAASALDQITAEAWRTHVTLHDGLVAMMPEALWCALPEEIRVRLIVRLLRGFSHIDAARLLSRAEAIAARLLEPDFRRQTTGGATIERTEDKLSVWREPGRLGLPTVKLPPGESALWDGRFAVSADRSAPAAVEVRAVGLPALRKIRSHAQRLPMLPDRILATAPGFWAGETLVSVPSFEFSLPGWEKVVAVRIVNLGT